MPAVGHVATLAGIGSDDAAKGFKDGSGSAARFDSPKSVAVDSGGNMIIADTCNSCIRKVTVDGMVTTLAGSTTTGSADGLAATASFGRPQSVTVIGDGSIIVADCNNNRIRKVTPDGMVSTLAGGEEGFADGTGAAARFKRPYGVAADRDGNVVVSDYGNNIIRKVTADGIVTTLAGTGSAAFNDGAAGEAIFNGPTGVAVDSDNNVFVADCHNNCIRKISVHGNVTTLAGRGNAGYADGEGDTASFKLPIGLAVDADGNVVVADGDNNCIRIIAPGGTVTTLAGSGRIGNADGPGDRAQFTNPRGVAVDRNGNVVVTDSHRVRVVVAELSPPLDLILSPELRPRKKRRTLSEDFGALLTETSSADVTFIVNSEAIMAHRVILQARSDYFCRMFTSEFVESRPGAKIDIQDATPEAFKLMLRYLYTGCIEFDAADVIQVMRLADRYGLTEVYEQCHACCKRNISVENCISWLIQANEYGLASLRRLALIQVADHLHTREIQTQAVDTLQQLTEHPALMREVLLNFPVT
eukprot:gnl/TRDRNA2_/TRDRNA2_31612_c0_seq1.p1 gnl/TRDRNA2_/TRDRNA2_31612_c0~~gnl/TRDRNA2_/TRDRNA2_31612_c0_seq1.p1  ORF type:complete len:529 (+),score=64.97 gnl/TRDRNA2_/TRDRNA2_31612_c0_seq1:52-1638(+)